MSFIDPAEGGAITAAVNWSQDHGCVSEYPSLDALTEAASRLAPTCDPATLRAYVTEHLLTEQVGVYVLALAPPFPPLPAGAWRAGPVDARGGRSNGFFLLITCEPEQLARLCGGAK